VRGGESFGAWLKAGGTGEGVESPHSNRGRKHLKKENKMLLVLNSLRHMLS